MPPTHAHAHALIFILALTSIYADIFVRHAFGSVRDIVREVAYSPMMATYLTYRENKALFYDGKYPDENFAR